MSETKISNICLDQTTLHCPVYDILQGQKELIRILKRLYIYDIEANAVYGLTSILVISLPK
jgi:hypothetical protein